MALEQLLGDTPKSQFFKEHFLKLPYSQPQGAQAFAELGSWRTIETILERPDPDVLVVREGSRWEENRVPTPEEARQLYADGYTLLVRHAEKDLPELYELAEDFRRDFLAPVDVHLYCTPGTEYGFGWHYDAEDVFILQTEGSKEYLLRKNTVNPWPLVETLPADMRFEREMMPVMKCLLKAGDWLYIPNGYWHAGKAQENAVSLAVGVLTTSAMDAFDFLRQRLLDSMMWRRRLPPPGQASHLTREELLQQYREVFAELGEDLASTFQNEAFLRSFLISRGVKLDDDVQQ